MRNDRRLGKAAHCRTAREESGRAAGGAQRDRVRAGCRLYGKNCLALPVRARANTLQVRYFSEVREPADPAAIACKSAGSSQQADTDNAVGEKRGGIQSARKTSRLLFQSHTVQGRPDLEAILDIAKFFRDVFTGKGRMIFGMTTSYRYRESRSTTVVRCCPDWYFLPSATVSR